jgi:uncharacterized protein YidB (DUF937 family)
MGFLDMIMERITGTRAPAETGRSGMMEVVTELLSDPATGGIQGLVGTFNEKGMGDMVSSWIGTGPNLPISGEQIQAVLGSERIRLIAQRLGLSPSDAADGLAKALPDAIDKLTPNGVLPEGSLLEKGLSTLTGQEEKKA